MPARVAPEVNRELLGWDFHPLVHPAFVARPIALPYATYGRGRVLPTTASGWRPRPYVKARTHRLRLRADALRSAAAQGLHKGRYRNRAPVASAVPAFTATPPAALRLLHGRHAVCPRTTTGQAHVAPASALAATDKEGTVSLSASRRGQGRATRTAHDIRACHAPGAPSAREPRTALPAPSSGGQPRASGAGQVDAAGTRLAVPPRLPAQQRRLRLAPPPRRPWLRGRAGQPVGGCDLWVAAGCSIRARPGGLRSTCAQSSTTRHPVPPRRGHRLRGASDTPVSGAPLGAALGPELDPRYLSRSRTTPDFLPNNPWIKLRETGMGQASRAGELGV